MPDKNEDNFKPTGVRMSEELIAHLKIQAIHEKTNFQNLVNRICWDYLEMTVPELIAAKEKRVKEVLKKKDKNL